LRSEAPFFNVEDNTGAIENVLAAATSDAVTLAGASGGLGRLLPCCGTYWTGMASWIRVVQPFPALPLLTWKDIDMRIACCFANFHTIAERNAFFSSEGFVDDDD
jgi:hypothetical protein